MSSSVVFLSSTVEDMQDERDAASEVLNFLKKQVSRCEYFPARTNSPKEVCLSEARDCDVFIGIYKNRYGFIPTEDNQKKISVTELEYEEAKKAKKPILIFYYYKDVEREDKLNLFLERIKNFSKGHYVKNFENIQELKYLILQSLVSQFQNNDKFTKEELELLSKNNPEKTEYQRVLLNQLEYGDPKGVSRPSILLSYRIRDLYVPPEITRKKSSGIDDLDDLFYYKTLEFPQFQMSWNDIEKYKNPKEDQMFLSTGIDVLAKLEEKQPLVVLGGPGYGKTTLLKMMCSDLILNSPIIPFFISIKDLSNELNLKTINNVIEFLAKKFSDLEIKKDFFYDQLRSGSCLIVFDGLDEVWETESRVQLNDLIQQFCSKWNQNNKIIISSRVSGYLQQPLRGNFEIVNLEPFTAKKIKEYVIKWAHLIANEKQDVISDSNADENAIKLINLLGSDKHLLQIASSPIILNIICLTFLKNTTFPKRKHLLYSVLFETLLSSWDERKGIDNRKLDWTEYLKILRKISFKMYDNQQSQINQIDLYELIKVHLKEEGISEIEGDSVRDIITNLEERSGIIINDGMGNFSFYHLSFLEYLVSLELTTSRNIKEIFDYLQENFMSGKNLEIISFTSSLLSDKSRNLSSDFLNRIIKIKSKYQEIHVLHLLTVLHSLSQGTTVTNEFKKNIFDLIDKSWDERRVYDRQFFKILSGLLNTPLEKDIVDLWRQKCKTNPLFYMCDLSDDILVSENYFDDLVDFCEADLSNEINLFSSIHLSTFVSDNPTKKLIRFILKHPRFEDLIVESTIFGMVDVISKDKVLKNLYFKKIKEIKNKPILFLLLKYSYLIDKERSTKYLSSLPCDKFTKFLNDQLLGRDHPTHLEQFKKLFQQFLENKEPDEYSVRVGVTVSAMPQEYQKDMWEYIFSELKKLPESQKNHAIHICYMLYRNCTRESELKLVFEKFVPEFDKDLKKWKKYLIGVLCQIQGPTEENKKFMLNIMLDPKANFEDKGYIFEILTMNYLNDDDVAQLISSLINENDTFQTHCLYFLSNNPHLIKHHIQDVVKAYFTGPLENYFVLPVDIIREYIGFENKNEL